MALSLFVSSKLTSAEYMGTASVPQCINSWIIHTYTSDSDAFPAKASTPLSAAGYRAHGRVRRAKVQGASHSDAIVALFTQVNAVPNVPTHPSLLDAIEQDIHHRARQDYVGVCRFRKCPHAFGPERSVCTH